MSYCHVVAVALTVAGGVGILLGLKLDIQLQSYLNPPPYTQNLHRIQFWGMVASVEAEGDFHDAHRQEDLMPLAEVGGDLAAGGRDANIDENVGLNAVIGLEAVAAAAVVVGLGLADPFLTGFAYTYLDNNPFLPPLF